VVELTEVPTGQPGRRSKSLTAGQADDVLTKTAPDRLHAYIVVSLLTGARTAELRALGWEHVHLDPDTGPPYLEVWRSVRAHGDTKTRKSRRTLALASLCIDALRVQRVQQAKDRLAAGERWTETGLVFTTRLGTAWTPPMSAVTFAAPWLWCPGSIRPTGPRVSYGTLSFRCSPMPACPSGTSRSSSATAAPPSPSWSTGIRSGPSSRPAQRSWIGSSDTAAQVRSHSVAHSPGRCRWFGRPERVSDLVGDTGFEPVTSSV
jgi:hypothetical protein